MFLFIPKLKEIIEMNDRIEQKIEKFERDIKKLRIFNTILIIIVSSFVVFGFQQKIKLPDFELPSVIEAEAFVLKGKNGKAAEFKVIDDRNVAIIFYKDNGKKVALNLGLRNDNSYIHIPNEEKSKLLISEDSENAYIYLSNSSGNNDSYIQLSTNSTPNITMKQSNNNIAYINNNGMKILKDSILMMCGKDFAFQQEGNSTKIYDLPGAYGLSIYKANNLDRDFYYASGYDPASNNSYVEVYNPKTKTTASMKVINNSPGILAIKDNILRYLVYIDENDKMTMKLNDNQGKPRSVLGSESLNINGKQTKTEESSILLFDKDGKMLERLPK